MTGLTRFKENTLIKAIVIPLIITALAVIIFFVSLPAIADAVPNAEAYTAQTFSEGEQADG